MTYHTMAPLHEHYIMNFLTGQSQMAAHIQSTMQWHHYRNTTTQFPSSYRLITTWFKMTKTCIGSKHTFYIPKILPLNTSFAIKLKSITNLMLTSL